MMHKNAVYTKEYQEYRSRFEYVFSEKYKCSDGATRLLADGEHTLVTSYYSDSSHKVLKYNIFASKTEVFNKSKNKVAEFKNINHKVDFFSLINHSNGNTYLIFSIDLYGYSIMNLSNYKAYHYIPEESFKKHKETFIWTEVHYCKENNILAVEGCYWAYPFSTEFFDFSNPEELPFKRIFSSYEMDGEIDIGNDVVPVRWNDDGTIVLKCSFGEGGVNQIEKTIDILS